MKYKVFILNDEERSRFDDFVRSHPQGSFLQTSAWARVKEKNGWTSQIVVLQEGDSIVGGAQIFRYGLPFGRSLSYIPYGPLWDGLKKDAPAQLLAALTESSPSAAILIEPSYVETEEMTAILEAAGFHRASHTYQPQDSLIIDLSQSEEELQANMRQTTRRYIRQAERAGLCVREADPEAEMEPFYQVLTSVSKSQHFGIHGIAYYQEIWRQFRSAKLFFVEQGKKILGAYFLITDGDRAWELYGGVYPEAKESRASYLLKWEVIRAMKALGVRRYDQWGVAPEGMSRHELAGVTYFKEGFGGERVRLAGSYEKPRQRLYYMFISMAGRFRGLVR